MRLHLPFHQPPLVLVTVSGNFIHRRLCDTTANVLSDKVI